jgi:hypothetical protein
VAGMGRRESIFCWWRLRVTNNVEGLDVDLRIILNGNETDVRALIGLMWLGLEQVARCFEHGNEPQCSMKWKEFMGYLRKYWTLKEKLLHGLFVYLVGWLVGWLVG